MTQFASREATEFQASQRSLRQYNVLISNEEEGIVQIAFL
jgi:hypothetical protein